MLSPDELRSRLPTAARSWLDDASSAIRDDVTAIRRSFPAASREVGAEHGETVRLLLIAALGRREEIVDLYQYGDTHERRAILRSAVVIGADETVMDLARDAFRTNDPRLVIAAANEAVVGALTDDEVDQVLVKCVFMEIPLASVPALVERASESTARMLAGLVIERVTAGRSVTPDVWSVIDRFPPTDLLAQLQELSRSDLADRRSAAQEALNSRPT